MAKLRLFLFLAAVVLVGLPSCSLKRNLQEGQSIVKKNTIEVNPHTSKGKALVSDLEAYIAPQKNKSFLNMNVWTYNQHETKFKRTLKKVSDKPPSYFDEPRVSQSARKMTAYLQNKGYFGATVDYSFAPKKRNPYKTHVTYSVSLTEPYFVNEVVYDIENKEIEALLMPYLRNLRAGRQYDYYAMSTVRDRITEFLRNNGYYMFTADYVFFEIDSAFQNQTLKVTLNIKPNYLLKSSSKETYDELYDKQFFINDISIQPYYSKLRQNPALSADTITVRRVSYDNLADTVYFQMIQTEDKKYIHNRALLPNIYVEPGDLYSQENTRKARSNLTRLSAIGSASVVFDTIPRAQYADTSDVGWLHGNIILEQGIKRSLSLDIEATTDNVGTLGTALGVSWNNRNLFRGSETLTIRLKGAMEIQKTFGITEEKKTFGIFNTLDGGIQTTLSFPRFLAPVSPYRFPRFYRPSTDFNFGYNYQIRSDYERNLFLGSFGYRWKPQQKVSHNLTVLDVNLVKIDKAYGFDSTILSYHSRRLYEQYSDHFIMAMNYTIQYSTQEIGRKRNFSYFRVSTESCGNMLYAVNSLFRSPKSGDEMNDYYTLFNIRYAQYLKGYFEFRRYQYINAARDHVVFRFFGGMGSPYGNALSLPFEKSFYGGGTNDLRGFQINMVGPGGYVAPPGMRYERSGDIKLEVNGEYRFTMSGMLKGALFTDLGNVWLLKNDDNFKDGHFQLADFYRQLYWNAGFGIRFDVDILLVRLDLGLPLYNPGYEDDKWRVKHTKFSSIVFNFGLGYPF
ncbi:MAG: BamA/TamA family outer membrane protein [Bacteroidales bacterium]|nr:BamA/TamA family outer membrane protein [Bacteroidales bacterium]